MRQNSSGKLLAGNGDPPVRPKNERCDYTPGPPKRKRKKQSVVPVGTGRETRQGKYTAENRPCQSRKGNMARTGLVDAHNGHGAPSGPPCALDPLFARYRVCHFAICCHDAVRDAGSDENFRREPPSVGDRIFKADEPFPGQPGAASVPIRRSCSRLPPRPHYRPLPEAT
jgi:hypothetical protein